MACTEPPVFMRIGVGTQFGLQLGKMESQKKSCIDILDRWLNAPTNKL
jgi:hypothetical protein